MKNTTRFICCGQRRPQQRQNGVERLLYTYGERKSRVKIARSRQGFTSSVKIELERLLYLWIASKRSEKLLGRHGVKSKITTRFIRCEVGLNT